MNSVISHDTRLTYRNLLHILTLTMKCHKGKVKKKSNPFKIASKSKTKYLRIHFIKEVKDLQAENCG